MNIEEELIKEEGLSLRPYKDSVGNITIGVGHLLDSECGVITLEYAGKLLADDIAIARKECQKYSFFFELGEVRQYVMIDMMFNLGAKRFKTFKKMLMALENKNYELASAEMLDSLWARQVGNRAAKLAKIMKKGIINE